ncbi:MAG: hypothetical protein GYA46_11470 [candidate division Zixibacteria bacterium]|nr:hypothetical protein [candidate division Zixibacteria bacterium]
MKARRIMISMAVCLICLGGVADAQQPTAQSPPPTGPYLGQTPPGMTPALFAPGIVSTEAHEFSFTISPDGKEIYFTRKHPELRNRIMVTRWEKSGWTTPEMAFKASDDEGMEPFLPPDGKTLFYQTWRQAPEATAPSMDIWTITRTGNGWSDPVHLGAPFNPGKSMYIGMAADGTVYTTDISGGMGTGSIVATRLKDGAYEPFTPLPSSINATGREIYPCIAPDGSFLLFTRINDDKVPGLYATFRTAAGAWSEPKKLDLGQKAASMPSLSPDGKYLFFTSMSEKAEGNIFWVDARIIESLRPKQ